jgi:sigma-E factor negative regulatory protein RseB
MIARALAFAAGFTSAVAVAQTPDGQAWLRRIHQATQKLSYTGTFVYQQGARTETSRITRFVGPGGDIERVEVLDGVPREIVRTRDTLRCYLPDSKVVKVDRRTPDRSFPTLLPEQVNLVSRNYSISLGETTRVAGLDCRAVVLTPKDNVRYGYRLYADMASGMLLKAVTIDAGGEAIEQFMFTQLKIGNVTRDMVRPHHDARGWRVEDAQAVPAHLVGWELTADLPGFRKVIELRRRMESRAVSQVVYSDGLAAVSVFIEALDAQREAAPNGIASMGAIHMYTREVANHRVTVVGETPAASVQRIGNAVAYRKPQ